MTMDVIDRSRKPSTITIDVIDRTTKPSTSVASIAKRLFKSGKVSKMCSNKTTLFEVLKLGYADTSIIDELLDAGADIDEVDIYGSTPLIWAIKLGYKEGARRLFDRGANVSIKNHYESSALINIDWRLQRSETEDSDFWSLLAKDIKERLHHPSSDMSPVVVEKVSEEAEAVRAPTTKRLPKEFLIGR